MSKVRSTILAGLSAVALIVPLAGTSGVASAQTAPCVTSAPNGGCPGDGGYSDVSIDPMSNGSDTYVTNQAVNPFSGTVNTITAYAPNNWSVNATEDPPGNGAVQYFDAVFQLTNDWNGSGWGTGNQDTPLAALSALQIRYTESMPTDAVGVGNGDTSAEYAPDFWDSSNGGSDVMFWADTVGRCNPGAYGGTILGTAVMDGQTWTVNRYGGPGAEIIFVLDSNPSVPDSCAQQTSGTIHIREGAQWLVNHGYWASLGTFSQLNTGWELTSAGGTNFTVSKYTIDATVRPAVLAAARAARDHHKQAVAG